MMPRSNPMLARWKRLYDNPTKHELLAEEAICLLGVPYRFQHPIGHYFLDFGLPTLQVAVEIDGDSHKRPAQIAKDEERNAKLAEKGWAVLRYWNDEVAAWGVADFRGRLEKDLRLLKVKP